MLREKAPHTFETEQQAIEFLSSGKIIDKGSLLEHLEAISFMKNRKRPVASTTYWQKLQGKILKHFQEYALYKNAVFVEEIDPLIFPIQNMVITNVLTPTLLELLDENCSNCVILLLSNYGESPAQLENNCSTVTFDILMEEAVQIDSVNDYLPQTTISASLFLPDAPEGDSTAKVRYLRSLAIQKQCSLGSTISIRKVSELCKLPSDYDNILLYLSSAKMTEMLLQNLNFYEKITVSGDVELKKLVAQCLPFPKFKKIKAEFADEEPELETADEMVDDNDEN